ncbi:MAG: protease modulator HflC [Desulfovibrionaceae bacterium]
MNTTSLKIILPLFLILVIYNSIFFVQEYNQAIVLQLGEPIKVIEQPGLQFKIPLLQNVIFVDSRVLMYNIKQAEALTSDKKTIVLDSYASWRIDNPLLFYRTLRTQTNAQIRLDDIIYSQLRVEIGKHTLTEVVSSSRTSIMDIIAQNTASSLKDFGIKIVDVRIKKTDLPKENQQAIFERMRSERKRQAQQYRSEGEEESIKIRSQTEKEQVIILAESEEKSTLIRGEADALKSAVYSKAYAKNPSFYSFIRSLQSYEESFKNNTTIMLTPKDPFLQYFN